MRLSIQHFSFIFALYLLAFIQMPIFASADEPVTNNPTLSKDLELDENSDLNKLYKIALAGADLLQTLIVKIKKAASKPEIPVDHTTDNNVYTLYVYPPKILLNWSSPKESVFTFAALTVDKLLHAQEKVHFVDPHGETGVLEKNYISTMGHSITHVRCQLSNGEQFNEWTSFSGQNYPKLDMQLTFKNQIGAGQLFFPYADGHIIHGNENIIRLVYVSNNEGYGPRFWQTKLNSKQCDNLKKMIDFYTQYHYDGETTSYEDLANREIKDKIYFTGILDPYKTYHERMDAIAQGMDPNSVPVGGGCAPYGIALKKETGTYDYDLDDRLLLKVAVNENLIGNDIEYAPTNHSYVSNGSTAPNGKPIRRVSLLDMKKAKSWEGDDPGAAFEFSSYDPYKIWAFIGEVSQCLKEKGKNLKQNFAEKPICSEAAQKWLAKFPSSRKVEVGETRTLSHVRKPPTVKPMKCYLNKDTMKNDKDCSDEPETTTANINGIVEG